MKKPPNNWGSLPHGHFSAAEGLRAVWFDGAPGGASPTPASPATAAGAPARRELRSSRQGTKPGCCSPELS